MNAMLRLVLLGCLVAAPWGCAREEKYPAPYSIEQINPRVILADVPTTVVITGAAMDDVDWVRFGFSKDLEERKEIATVDKVTLLSPTTIEVEAPQIPQLDGSVRVWVSVGRHGLESDAVRVHFRPSNFLDHYGAWVIAGLVLFMVALFLLPLARRQIRHSRRLRMERELEQEMQWKREERENRRLLKMLETERERDFAQYLEEEEGGGKEG